MEVPMHALRWAQPQAAAVARRPVPREEPVDQVELAPAQVLQSAATRKVPTETLLKALGHVAVQAGCNALPSPTIRGVLLATQALQREPEANSEALRTFQVQLDRWALNGQFLAPEGALGQIWGGQNFRVVGKQVFLGEPKPLPPDLPELLKRVPDAVAAGTAQEHGYTLIAFQRALLENHPELATEDFLRPQLVPLLDVWGAQETAQVIHAHYGPEVLLSTLLDQKEVLSNDCWKPITDDVRQLGFRPSEGAVRRLTAFVASEAGKFDRHNSNYEAAIELTGQILEKHPDLLDATSRQQIQDALVNRQKDPFWASYSAFVHDGAATVATGTPELVSRLLDKMDNPVAQALLIRSPLSDERWEELRAHVDALPREDQYRHHFSYFAEADLQRRLDRLTPKEAVEQVLQIRGRVDEGSARHMVFQKICAGREGEQPHLAKVAGWYHDAVPFWRVFEKAALNGTIEQTRADAEKGLAAMSEGLIGGHQTLVARLMDIQDHRTIEDMMARYRTVQGRLDLNHGSLSTTVHTVAALEIFGLGSREQLNRGVDWLQHSLSKQDRDEAFEQLEKLAKSVRERKAADRVAVVLERMPLASMDSLTRLLALPDGEALERSMSFGEKVGSLDRGMEIAEISRGHELASVHGVVERLVAATLPPDEMPPLVGQALKLISGGASLDSALQSVLRGKLLDEEPAAPAASSIGVHNNQVRVGGVVLRGRKRGF